MMQYYIASCVFTSRLPRLSQRVQAYITSRWQLPIVRCCVPKYSLEKFTSLMPEDYQETWAAMPDCAPFQPGDTVYSICHNCANILEETHPGVQTPSIYELILSDSSFPYPDYAGMTVTVQDCWRARDRKNEQTAVRALLEKMHIYSVELPDNLEKTNFCGASLYRPQPPRNPALAPKHYDVKDKFLPHTPQEQKAIMEDYCRRFTTKDVVCYCHYCLEGLQMGGVHGIHLASLLFPEESEKEKTI